MSLNANLIKELREKSGAGIVDCKNALMQNDNDIENAHAEKARQEERAKQAAPMNKIDEQETSL